MMSSSGRRSAVRAVAVVLVAVGYLLASASFAAAHTALRASSPQDGSRIDAAPGRIVLEFTEPIQNIGARVAVQGPDGREYQAGAPYIVDNKLTEALKPLGRAGDYRIEFRVVAADGHPQTFGIRFTLTKPGPAAGGAAAVVNLTPLPPAGSAASVNNAPGWAPWLASGLALILLSGAVLFGRRTTHGLD
jgi:methionine-rich copper-binding protein CopC